MFAIRVHRIGAAIEQRALIFATLRAREMAADRADSLLDRIAFAPRWWSMLKLPLRPVDDETPLAQRSRPAPQFDRMRDAAIPGDDAVRVREDLAV